MSTTTKPTAHESSAGSRAREGADLMVMGTRGRTGATHILSALTVR